MSDADILDRLYRVIQERRRERSAESYVVKLLDGGCDRIASKVREEADELIEAVESGDREHAAREAADLLFHAWVLLASIDVDPGSVFRVLEERFGTGGLAEKAARSRGQGS
jgi:phosphoribosyl-ATP pyrophosphohydrolase